MIARPSINGTYQLNGNVKENKESTVSRANCFSNLLRFDVAITVISGAVAVLQFYGFALYYVKHLITRNYRC